MADKTSRGGTRRRSTSTGRVDAPKGKAQWMDDPNAPINNVDPNAVYVAPDASGADNNHIDPNAVYVAPSVSGSSGVTRPGNSNTVTRPTSSGSPSRPSTGNTVTRPTTSTVVVKPLVDKTVIQNLLYIKVVDGGKRAEEVVARMMGQSWSKNGINAAGGYDRLYLIKDEKTEKSILTLAADLIALGAKIELKKRIEIEYPLI